MRVPMSWLREHVSLPESVTTEQLTDRLTALGLKLEALERPGHDMAGPLVVGRVLSMEPEPQKNGKTINWCSVDVGDANGTGEPQGIVCGAHNFAVGDLVVCVLPGGVLPGPFEIAARKTYGHVSAGMICSTQELGLGEDHDGILVLPEGSGEPGDDVFDLLPLREEVVELEINPDRAYALSIRGVAREVALGLDLEYVDPADRQVPPADGAGHPVSIEDPEGCPVFVARTVSGFDATAPTPDWMARRLLLAGMRPISLAVDVTNYVMLELGRPLHGYDADKLTGTVGVRRAHEGERLTTLDGTRRDLDPDDLVVVDDSGAIGLGGVMGGEATEMSATTTRVLVESAHWDPVSMFRTGRRHRLTSEAGRRNERGVDPTICEVAAQRAVELLVEHGGGTIDDGVTVVGSAPVREPISMPVELPAAVSGMAIPADTTFAHLVTVGCDVEVDPRGSALWATPPPWRPDLSDPYDLVEEVARVVGYEQVPSVLPEAPSGRGLTRVQSLRRRVGRALAGAGHVEAVSFPFVGDADLDRLGLGADDPRRTTLRLANPLSTEAPSMTTTLLPGLLAAAARNAGRGQPDVGLFEIAAVTRPDPQAPPAPILPVDHAPTAPQWEELQRAVPAQPLHLALTVSGVREPAGWWGPARPASWADAVEAVRVVADALGVEVEVRAAASAPWHPGRCAEVVVPDGPDGTEVVVGHAGELHPRVCASYDLPARSAAAEVDLDLLMAHARDVVTAPRISSFPVAKEDVALVVDDAVVSADVAAALREGAGDLCESVRLFDLYTGEQIGPGRKSLAFALRFRAPDRTLTDAETAEARNAAVALAVERHGAEQRV